MGRLEGEENKEERSSDYTQGTLINRRLNGEIM